MAGFLARIEVLEENESAPGAPPATAAPKPDSQAALTVRLMDSTIEALAREAIARGEAQRRLIARDLEDQPPRRRRGQ